MLLKGNGRSWRWTTRVMRLVTRRFRSANKSGFSRSRTNVLRQSTLVQERLLPLDQFVVASVEFHAVGVVAARLLAFVAAAVVGDYLALPNMAKEYLHYAPEMFAEFASEANVANCSNVPAFVLPVSLHPMVLPCVPHAVGALNSRTLGSFQRRDWAGRITFPIPTFQASRASSAV